MKSDFSLILRPFWLNLIAQNWEKKNVLWLQGIRRAGKTSLCKTIKDCLYFDCELPRTRALLEEDPEGFLNQHDGKTIALDEIHRLKDPSELLKITADHYPKIRLIATGSSSISASSLFRDKLTDRKREIFLSPLLVHELAEFQIKEMDARLLHGGLPSALLSKEFTEDFYKDWIDSYWAKDIQLLFRLEKRNSFIKFFELLTIQSGGIFEASQLSAPCEVSRTTIANYLQVLKETNVVYIVSPFKSNRSTEIVSAPKVFIFDTGFVCFGRGIRELRNEDRGLLWEHIVLNDMMGALQSKNILYWRDKRGHEIDFVLSSLTKTPIAIECKWTAKQFDPTNLKAFRYQYPKGLNFVVSWNIESSYVKKINDMKVRFVSLPTLLAELKRPQK